MNQLIANAKAVIAQAAGAISSWDPKWVNMAFYRKVVFILNVNVTSGTDSANASVKQATNSSGSGSKAVSISKYYYNNDTASGQDLTEGTATNNQFAVGGATKSRLYVVEVDAEDLDVNNNYAYVRLELDDDIANANGCLVAVLTQPRYAEGPAGLPSSA